MILKEIPEDFIVKEHADVTIDGGPYAYYVLKKKNMSTPQAVERIADALYLNLKYINVAGNKDKAAITEQFVSINKGPHKNLDLTDLSLSFLGTSSHRLNLGKLRGNEFTVTARDLTQDDVDAIKENANDLDKIPNTFDEQRFGVNKNNHRIGKALLKDFKKACELIEGTKQHLEAKPTDFIGALRQLDKRILRFYIHAYQSYLWNETALRVLEKKQIRQTIPLIGFGTEPDPELKSTISHIMNRESITFRDFIIRELPELSSEGDDRSLFIKIQGFSIETLDDDLHPGKKKAIFRFFLPKGSYATTVVKYLFKVPPSQ